MKRRRLSEVVCVLGLTAPIVGALSCQPSFPTTVSGESLAIQITGGNVGSQSSRLPLTFSTPVVYTVTVQAEDQSGSIDSTFNGYVRFSVTPGTVVSVTAPASENPEGRNVKLVNGVATDVQVAIVGAYGDAIIGVEDLGYEPINPLGVPLPDGGVHLPQCANGVDDNHNGLVDYPADPGCYAANDNTEDGGTYASAATSAIYFEYPNIPVVNGVDNGGAGTPFPNEAVQIDTGWNGSTTSTPDGVVVTGVASTGFFVTDVSVKNDNYGSVYAYTYSAPPLMNVCDRLISFGGTSAEFYGFLEINYPTWSLEEWDPVQRPCLVPEPTLIPLATLESATVNDFLIPLEAGLVRVPANDGSTISIASKLGPGLIPYTTASNGTVTVGAITADATSCDYEGTGKIDFEDPAEAACETACEADVQCSEYTAFISNQQFQIVVTDATGTSSAAITGNGAAAPEFNPLQLLGSKLTAFTGNLTYFSGGSQFTIQARCADDIVIPGVNTVLPSSPPWPTKPGEQPAPAACVVSLANQTTTN